MGHSINWFSVPEKAKREDVMEKIMESVSDNGGDHYSSTFTWHTDVAPLASREDAVKWIKAHDKGWYDDHAVRYYDYSQAVRSKQIAELENKAAEMTGKIAQYEKTTRSRI